MPLDNYRKLGSAVPPILGITSLVLIVVLYLAFRSGGGAKLESFPYASYLEKPGDFLGNTYVLRGQIDSQIKWKKSLGRVVAVRPEASTVRLPVFVPEGVGGNIQPGQRFDLQVLIQEGGLIYVEALRKY